MPLMMRVLATAGPAEAWVESTPESRFLHLPPQIVPFVLADRFEEAEIVARGWVAETASRAGRTTPSLAHGEALRSLSQLYLWRAADGDPRRADSLLRLARPAFAAYAADSTEAWFRFLETEVVLRRRRGGR